MLRSIPRQQSQSTACSFWIDRCKPAQRATTRACQNRWVTVSAGSLFNSSIEDVLNTQVGIRSLNGTSGTRLELFLAAIHEVEPKTLLGIKSLLAHPD